MYGLQRNIIPFLELTLLLNVCCISCPCMQHPRLLKFVSGPSWRMEGQTYNINKNVLIHFIASTKMYNKRYGIAYETFILKSIILKNQLSKIQN